MVLETNMCDFELVSAGHKTRVMALVNGNKLSYLQSKILITLFDNFDKEVNIYDLTEKVWGYSLAHDMRPFSVHLSKIRVFIKESDPNYVLILDGSVVKLTHYKPMDKLESTKKSLLALLKMKPSKLITNEDLELINLLTQR